MLDFHLGLRRSSQLTGHRDIFTPVRPEVFGSDRWPFFFLWPGNEDVDNTAGLGKGELNAGRNLIFPPLSFCQKKEETNFGETH